MQSQQQMDYVLKMCTDEAGNCHVTDNVFVDAAGNNNKVKFLI